MRQIRILGLAILPVFALSAIVAAAAQAKGGPFFKIKGTRLVAGQKEEVTAVGSGKLNLKATGITITCQQLHNKAGAEIIGSSGANSSTGRGTIELAECKLTGNGTKCGLAASDKGVIQLESAKSALAYPKKVPAKGDVILAFFQPESGSVFAKIKVEAEGGGKCTVEGALAVEGSMAGEAQNEKEEPFKLLEKVTETVTGKIKFPISGTEACTEKEGVITCVKPKLTLSTKTAIVEGSTGGTLLSKNVSGVLSE
jgi:hypothetical protein